MGLVDKKMDLEYALAGKNSVEIDIHSLCTGITLDVIGRLCFNKPMHGIIDMGQPNVIFRLIRFGKNIKLQIIGEQLVE